MDHPADEAISAGSWEEPSRINWLSQDHSEEITKPLSFGVSYREATSKVKPRHHHTPTAHIYDQAQATLWYQLASSGSQSWLLRSLKTYFLAVKLEPMLSTRAWLVS